MTTRLQIRLSPEDRNALQERAEKELRNLRQQALQLVREGLANKTERNKAYTKGDDDD